MVIRSETMSDKDFSTLVRGCQECAIRLLAWGGVGDGISVGLGLHIEMLRGECKACDGCCGCVVASALGVKGGGG